MSEEIPSEVSEEFIVCGAAGYPDPFRPHPNTLEEARRFARDHSVNATGERLRPVVRRRLVSEWAVISDADQGWGRG